MSGFRGSGISPRLLDAGNAARLAGELERAAWYHERLLRGVNEPGRLTAGDIAWPWVFRAGQRALELVSPRTKRGYSLLTVALTRSLQGRWEEATELAKAGRETGRKRVKAMIYDDLRRLAEVRPEWAGVINDFLLLVGPAAE